MDDSRARAAVAEAMQDAVERVGIHTLVTGGRTEAILRDLIGSSDKSQHQRVRAVALMVDQAARQPRPTEDEAVQAIPAELAEHANWAAELVSAATMATWTSPNEQGVNKTKAHSDTGRRVGHGHRVIAALALVVLLVTVGWLGIRWLDGGTDGGPDRLAQSDPDLTSSTGATDSTPSTVTSGVATGLSASYPPLREGGVTVERNIVWWDDTGRALVSLQFTGATDQPTSALHREATFGSASPEGIDPPAALSGAVLTYDLALQPEQIFSASYLVPLDGPPTVEKLQQFLTEWIARRDAAIPSIDDREPVPEALYEECRTTDDGGAEISCTPVG